MSFKAGDVIGDYEVVGPLGAGGMGEVYKVRNTLSDRMEAMKVLLPQSVGSAEQAERFLREIRRKLRSTIPTSPPSARLCGTANSS